VARGRGNNDNQSQQRFFSLRRSSPVKPAGGISECLIGVRFHGTHAGVPHRSGRSGRHGARRCRTRLTLAFEQVGDPRPQRFALTGEVMGKALGLVISWSGGGRQLLR
jgi:hypothetical protein